MKIKTEVMIFGNVNGGYSLSGSLDSYNKYKYREYVAVGKYLK